MIMFSDIFNNQQYPKSLMKCVIKIYTNSISSNNFIRKLTLQHTKGNTFLCDDRQVFLSIAAELDFIVLALQTMCMDFKEQKGCDVSLAVGFFFHYVYENPKEQACPVCSDVKCGLKSVDSLSSLLCFDSVINALKPTLR